MNDFVKSLLLTMGLNAGVFLLSFAEPFLFVVFFGFVAIELVVGFVFAIGGRSSKRGQGILVGCLVSFLIGYSVCSSMTYHP